MRQACWICFAWIVLCVTCFPLTAADDRKPLSGSAPANYVLGPDDEIVIQALHVAEISDKPFRIDSAGHITVPMIGRVQAKGLTVSQLEAELTSRLASFIREPEVTVRIAEFKSQPVSVLGAVKTPGVYHLRGRITLMEVLSAAGGLEPEAGGKVNITRQSDCGALPVANARKDPSGNFTVGEVNLKPLLDAQDPANNFRICANDVIVVPRAKLIYVIGEVRKPGGFVLRDKETVSLLEAISMSEGLTRTAGPKNARILRAQAGQTQRQEIHVNLNEVLNGKAEDLKLRPDDILFVPDSKPKTAAARGLEAAVQMATGVVIWGGRR
jgi:polysaccharide biosynthesis/export protein